MKKLVVIPSDPIHAYEAKGTSSWLKDYYNPQGYFDKVYVLSPLEKNETEKYGLKIIPVANNTDYKKKLKAINPLCVRSYGGYWATDYAVYNKVKDIPIVSSVHDTNDELIHDSLKFSDFIITMSFIIKNKLFQNKLARKNKIEVLGNRVNTKKFKFINKDDDRILKIKNNFPKGKMILHVGRKTFQKNIGNVIESLKFLPDNYFFIQVGIGDEKQYEVIAKQNKVEERFFQINSINNSELPLWYNASDVVCIPSRWEGFGLVFIEAASCQAKIVTSDIAPMNEFLINDLEMNFLIKDYENPKEIAKTILQSVNSKKSNLNTLNNIKNKFSKKIIDQKEVDIYSKIGVKGINGFTPSYYCWKFGFFYHNNKHKLKNIPKRIWKKVLSYL